MKKILNRNHLKIIALLAMIIDHIGYLFFPQIIWLRIVGRLAFPIFALFVAEGYTHTHSKKKYVLTLLLFGIVSQVPYYLVFGEHVLNIMFTFVFSITVIYLMEQIKKNPERLWLHFILLLFHLFLIIFSIIDFIEYGFFGVYLVVMFYYIKDTPKRHVLFVLINIFLALPAILYMPSNPFAYVQLAAILSIPVFSMYNGQKGELNLKYMFYIAYPAHLLILYFINTLLLLP